MIPHERKIRNRIFLGCQGDSERSYGTFLHRLIENERRLHIDAVLLQPGAGDPLATIERAIKFANRREREHGAAYKVKAVLLDRDQFGQAPARDRRVLALARDAQLILVWQTPCHEALLLRHLHGCERLSLVSAREALKRLRTRWPDYDKGAPAHYLANKLTVEDLRRAYALEPGLRSLLDAMGYFSPPTKRR